MKCYVTQSGVMGFIPSMGKWILFATESEYIEFYHDRE